MFWLEFFHQLMTHIEVIYNQIRSCEIDVFKISEYIANLKAVITRMLKH